MSKLNKKISTPLAITIVIILAFILIGGIIYCLTLENRRLEETIVPKVLTQKKENAMPKTEKKTISEKEKEENLLFSSLSPDGKVKVSLLVREISDIVGYGGVFAFEYLHFVNLKTGEEKKIGLEKLVPSGFLSYTKKVLPELYYSYSAGSFKWSKDSKNLWGVIDLASSADPRTSEKIGVFRINVNTWEIEKIMIPTNSTFVGFPSPDALNIKRRALLFDAPLPDGGLALYLYDFNSGKKSVIVSYPGEIFKKYFKYFFDYNAGSWGGTTKSRKLDPKWINDNTISYLDFETREEVRVNVK